MLRRGLKQSRHFVLRASFSMRFSSLAGIRDSVNYEGQAAIELEQAMDA